MLLFSEEKTGNEQRDNNSSLIQVINLCAEYNNLLAQNDYLVFAKIITSSR